MRRISEYAAIAALGVASMAFLPASASAAADYKDIKRDDMPRDTRHAADDLTKDGKDVRYQRRTENGKTAYSLHWTSKDGKAMEARLDETGKVVDGPQAAGHPSKSSSKSDDANNDAKQGDTKADADVQYHGISNKDVRRDVPAEVLKTTDPFTKDAKNTFYQRQVRDGKTYYSVNYTTKDDKSMFVRVDDKGKLVLGPKTSDYVATNKDAVSPAAKTDVAVKREAINGEQLPPAVRHTIEQTMSNGGGHQFFKETRGNDVSYVVDYTVGEQQTSARVAADGRVIEASPLASVRNPTPAPAPLPAATPAAPAPAPAANPADAQLAAAREAAAAGPYQLLSGADQLPAEVRSGVEKAIEPGSSELLFQRFQRDTQNVYSVHYTTPKGQREFLAVDQTGKVVIKPRESKAQEGGKGVKFEAITGDQLPPEVRKQVEANGGAGHLFLERIQPDGDKTYLVQYTGTNGERMEARFNKNGKEVGKPRAAREQPFTILDKKDKD